MSDKKITQLTNITGANLVDADEFVVVDISADETKAITLGELKEAFDSGSGFVRITGDTMTGDLALSGADVTFGDNDKAIFGAGSDLEIYSNGSSSLIKESGAGNLYIDADNLLLRNAAGTENYLYAVTNGAVFLYYDNAGKLATTSTGIDVTGTVTADGLTVDTITGTSSPTPSKITISTGSTGSDWSLDDAWGRLAFYNLDGSSSGPKDHITLDAVAGISTGGASNLSVKIHDGAGLRERLNVGYNGDISFYEDTGTTPKFFWDASAERLGIGIAAPTSAIDVRGEAVFGSGTDGLKLSYSAGNSTGIIDTGFTSTGLEFRTGNSFAAIIDSSGNVGIGTSSPSDKLEVLDGALMLKSSSASGYPNLKFENGSRRYDVQIDGATQAFRIVDNTASAERMRIDSSGNLLVGTTNVTPSINAVEGIALSAGSFGGRLEACRANNATASFGRIGSDGDIMDFKKDGSTVGSIGTKDNDMYLGTGDTGLRFHDGNNQVYPTSTATGTSLDATIDLGHSGGRFKDLYLSGGVYLGGTGSANHLDDYEEGTWTPVLFNATGGDTATYSTQSGQYVKVGKLVYCQFRIAITAKGAGSGNIRVAGLPFTASSVWDFSGANCDVFYNNAATSWVSLKVGARADNTELYVYGQTAATTNTIREGNFTSTDINSNFEMRGSIVYRTT